MQTPVWIFTMQMSYWRYARDLNIPVIDITAKSGISTFAPYWNDLMSYKRGEMGIEEYSKRYYDKVIPTINTHPQDWEVLTQNKTFALACYCSPGKFCHRYLFSMLCIKYLESLGTAVEFQGELIPCAQHQYLYRNSADPFNNQ